MLEMILKMKRHSSNAQISTLSVINVQGLNVLHALFAYPTLYQLLRVNPLYLHVPSIFFLMEIDFNSYLKLCQIIHAPFLDQSKPSAN